jgi:hypothetical protein
LKVKHECELAELKEKWENPATLALYSKPSPRLLQLRDIERKKVLLVDYFGAEETKRIADALERDETIQAQQRIAKIQEKQFEQLAKRQKMELDAAGRFTHKQLCHLRLERAAILNPLEKQIKKAEVREKHEDKAIDAKTKRGRRDRAPVYEGDDLDLASPRTFRTIYRMRTSTGANLLNVQQEANTSRRSTARSQNQVSKQAASPRTPHN